MSELERPEGYDGSAGQPSDESADAAVLDALVEQFVAQVRSGDQPSVADYVQRYPTYAARIATLFPSILRMELAGAAAVDVPVGPRPWELVGQQLGDFRILRELGRGGMGVVYEADQVTLNRTVAIKVLDPSLANSPRLVARFAREAESAARLHHTNIVPVFGVGDDRGLHFYAMQRIEGASLSEVLRAIRGEETSELARQIAHRIHDGEPAAWSRRAAELALAVAKALEYAHGCGVLHRDVKPSNVLIDRDLVVRLTDFGLAKYEESPSVAGEAELIPEGDSVTNTGDVLGTFRYMAPEQFEGRADQRSDLYGLGLTLFELVAGVPAFGDCRHAALMREKTETGAPRLRSKVAAVPRDLETIVAKATECAPRDRYRDGAALRLDLECFLADLPIKARPTTWVERSWRWTRRNAVAAALIVCIVLSLATTTVVFAVGQHNTELALGEAAHERRKALAAEASAKSAEAIARDEADRTRTILKGAMASLERVMDSIVSRGHPDDFELTAVTDADADLLGELLVFFEQIVVADADVVGPRTAAARKMIGDIQLCLGRFGTAARHYRKALRAYEGLVSQAVTFARERADVLNELGRIYMRNGHEARARRVLTKANAILRSVALEDGGRFELATNLTLLAGLALAPETRTRRFWSSRRRFGRDRPAVTTRRGESYARDAVRTLEDLVQDNPEHLGYELALARAYRTSAELTVSYPGRRRQYEYFRQALVVLEAVAKRYPGDAVVLRELTETLSTGLGSPSSRSAEAQRAVDLAKQLLVANQADPFYRDLAARALGNLATSLEGRGDKVGAHQMYLDAVKHHRYAAEQIPDDIPILLGYAKAVEGLRRTKPAGATSMELRTAHRDVVDRLQAILDGGRSSDRLVRVYGRLRRAR